MVGMVLLALPAPGITFQRPLSVGPKRLVEMPPRQQIEGLPKICYIYKYVIGIGHCPFVPLGRALWCMRDDVM